METMPWTEKNHYWTSNLIATEDIRACVPWISKHVRKNSFLLLDSFSTKRLIIWSIYQSMVAYFYPRNCLIRASIVSSSCKRASACWSVKLFWSTKNWPSTIFYPFFWRVIRWEASASSNNLIVLNLCPIRPSPSSKFKGSASRKAANRAHQLY